LNQNLWISLSFYVGWWGIVHLAHRPALFFPLILVLSFLNLKWSPLYVRQPLWMVIAFLLGTFQDGLLQFLGWVDFAHNPWSEWHLPPPWIAALWILFPSAFAAFDFFKNRLFLQIVLGGVGGMASYMSGYKLGLLEFKAPLWESAGLYFLVWAFLFPLLMKIHKEICRPKIQTV